MAALADTSLAAANRIFDELREAAQATLAGAGISGQPEFRASAEMRYVGQGYEIRVPLPPPPFRPDQVDAIRAAFEREYRRTYGYGDETAPVEVVNWHFSAILPRLPTGVTSRESRVTSRESRVSERSTRGSRLPQRPVYFPETEGFVDCPIYDRYRLTAGTTFTGPAVVEESESTIVVLPGCRAEVDRFGNLVVTLPGSDAEDEE